MSEEKQPAREEVRQKMIDCIKEGRVEVAPGGEEAFQRMVGREGGPDFTVTEASANFWGKDNKGGLSVQWGTVSAGFGSLALWVDDHGTLCVDSEAMGREFCKKVLCKLLDQIPDEQFRR